MPMLNLSLHDDEHTAVVSMKRLTSESLSPSHHLISIQLLGCPFHRRNDPYSFWLNVDFVIEMLSVRNVSPNG